MRYILFVLLLLHIPLVYGQQLENQLLSELSKTSHTGSTNYNKWTKIADCNITSAWQDFGAVIDFLGNGSGNGVYYYGRIIARFKNQNAQAAPVNYWDLRVVNSNLSPANICAIRNGTKIELYIRIPSASTTLYFTQVVKGLSALSLYSGQEFLTEVPADDLVINCNNDEGQIGTVSDYGFYSSSPCYNANIALDATYNNASRLSNIIALRNLGIDINAVKRQAGIHFSLASESSNNESIKSAQILLESSNAYANTPSLNFYTANKQRATILNNGNIGIGTDNPKNALDVVGTIRATEIKVEAAPWPDYVFADDYQLKDLSEVEQYINANNHLPDVPAAETMEQQGVNLGEMNRILLKKVEELTLYSIAQNKAIAEKELEMQQVKAEIDGLKQQLEALLKQINH